MFLSGELILCHQEVSAMKWGSKVTASAVSIATIVLSILASYKWH